MGIHGIYGRARTSAGDTRRAKRVYQNRRTVLERTAGRKDSRMDLRDQDLTLLRSEARRRFQVMIDYIKEQVGEGYEYANDLVRVVLSDRACYYEICTMPEE